MSKKAVSRAVSGDKDIKLHEFIARAIEIKKGQGVTQKDIANKLGYEKPNMIAMMKAGDVKVPIEKVPALAEALGIEPAFLMRLAMAQYWTGAADAIAEVFGTILTPNEVAIIEHIRKVSKNTDPALTRDAEAKLKSAFAH